jgi:hypothetical protein
MEFTERKNGLIEGLDHQDTPNVFHGGIVHILQGILIFPDKDFGRFVSKGRHLDHIREDNRDQAAQPQPPVKHEEDRQGKTRNSEGAGQIGKLMSDETFQFFDIRLVR